MNFGRSVELPAELIVLIAGVWFVLKMSHLSFSFNCIFGLAYLGIAYFYLRLGHQVNIPLLPLAGPGIVNSP